MYLLQVNLQLFFFFLHFRHFSKRKIVKFTFKESAFWSLTVQMIPLLKLQK